jgi:hypothetical protein
MINKGDQMKKLFILLAVIAISVPMFADDALVLPKGVLRVTSLVNYATTPGAYDKDSKYNDYTVATNKYTAINAFNLGIAFEYGVTDWLTGALQWTPGYTVSSTFKDFEIATLGPFFTKDEKANLNGAFDLFVGAKMQIVGAKGLVANDKIRFAVAPGVKVPMWEPNWDTQNVDLLAGKEATITNDKHAWGLGTRLYADYVFNKMFYLNAYSEFIYYLEKKDALVAIVNSSPSAAPLFPALKGDVQYGYDLTFEIEPHFEIMAAEGLKFSATLPVTYFMTPKMKVGGSEVDNTDKSLLKVGPSVGLFFQKAFIPTEIKLSYILPVAGTNANKTSSITFFVKNYLKF